MVLPLVTTGMPEAIAADEMDQITQKLVSSPLKQSQPESDIDDEKASMGNFTAQQVESNEKEGLSDVYDFDSFIQRMRHPSCKPVLENIKRFLQVYLEKLNSVSEGELDEMIEAYRSFYSVIKVKLLQTAIWQSEEVSAQERTNAMEGLESLLLNQLHDRVLGMTKHEQDIDDAMEEKMVLHGGWIDLKHLDFPVEKLGEGWLTGTEQQWLYSAINEFQKINAYRTPRDKLICNLNGCKILHSLIQNKMSADDFLPLLIYCLVRANPSRLHSNINYITRFRAPDKIAGEVAYFFTHTMAAVEFIQKMDGDSLSIDPTAYEAFVNEAREQLLKQDDLYPERSDSPNALDEAEAKAEELFLKAKAAFQRTGQKASAAFKDLKESDLARKSLDSINRFVKELTAPKEGNDEELAMAMSMSVMEPQPLIDFEENQVDQTDDGAGITQ